MLGGAVWSALSGITGVVSDSSVDSSSPLNNMLEVLGEAIPNTALFFLGYVLLQALVTTAAEFLRIGTVGALMGASDGC